MAGEKATEAAVADLDAFFAQPRAQAWNRQIGMPTQHRQDPLAMRFNHMATVAESFCVARGFAQ